MTRSVIFGMEQTLLGEILDFIQREVRPVLLGHGGDIRVVSLAGGVLRFRLTGQCCGCPSAWLTAEELVKRPLMERFPALADVVADTDVDDELVRLAKDVLSGSWHGDC